VLKRERTGVLTDKKYVQFYDSIRNQWDLCRYFDFETPAIDDDESDDEVDEVDRAFEGMEPLGFPIDDEGVDLDESVEHSGYEEAEQEVNSYISNRVHSYSSRKPTLVPTFEPQNEIIDESVAFTLTRYLSLHFGYTPPLPLPQASTVDNDEWKLLLKTLALEQTGQQISSCWVTVTPS
jgi:hypothetical protein